MTEAAPNAADRIRAWRAARPVPQVRPEDECFDLTIDHPPLHVMDVSALLDERDALVAELATTQEDLRESRDYCHDLLDEMRVRDER